MKRFIINIVWFIGIFVIGLSVKKLLTPYYLGSNDFTAKIKDYKSHSTKFNTAVFGSSHMYRQFNPSLFDSLMTDFEISSYNFATGGTFSPESYYQYQKFIGTIDKGDIAYAFLELKPLKFHAWENTQTTKGSYWNTSSILSYALQYINASNYSREQKTVLTKTYLNSYVTSFIDFNILKGLLKKLVVRSPNGFYPLEKEASTLQKNNDFEIRNQEFVADTTVLQERILASKNIEHYRQNSNFNKAHLDFINKLIKSSEDNGVHLFFVVVPRLYDQDYKEIIPLLNEIPSRNRLELANFKDYSMFYMAENSFDIGHLNNKGADLFTQTCASLVTKKLEKR